MAPRLPFIGRLEELNKLKELLQRKMASFVVVKGRRRIGKSRLIEEFAKGQRFLKFEGLAPTDHITAQMQRDEFARQLAEQLKLPKLKGDDWGDLLTFLAKQIQSGRVIILFDEVSWMGSRDPTFLAKLKITWDNYFVKNNKLILILCGSVSTWIDDNILSSTAYFGRIAKTMTLTELSLPTCNQLLAEIGFRGSPLEKFILLSLTGGIPWYIELINPGMRAGDNIQQLCFTPDGQLVDEYGRIFHDLFGRRSDAYKKIIRFLVKKIATYHEIASHSEYKSGGVLTEYLNDLEVAGFIHRHYNWQFASGKETRLILYRLKDNYLRFYLKYIEPRLRKIKEGKLTPVVVSSLPGWDSMMGLQFENIVLNNRNLIIGKLGLNANDIVADNPYMQKTTSTQKGCQIDYLIQTKLNTLIACEIKFSRNLIRKTVISEVQQKLSYLKIPRGFSCIPVLIYAGDIDDSLMESDYFWKLINFGEYLNQD